MRKLVRCTLLVISLPVFLSLTGCPAMAAMRVAKKVSESSGDGEKSDSAKSSTAASAASDGAKPAVTP